MNPIFVTVLQSPQSPAGLTFGNVLAIVQDDRQPQGSGYMPMDEVGI